MSGTAEHRTTPRLLRASAERYGERLAVVDGSTRLTFVQLQEAALEVARAAIAAGIAPGDRVGIWAPNSVRFIVTALGLHCAGAAVVPINTRYRGVEAREILARVRARVVFVDNGFLGYDYAAAASTPGEDAAVNEALAELVVVDMLDAPETSPRRMPWSEFRRKADAVSVETAQATAMAVTPTDLSEVIFTSGTTGRAKGVTIQHGPSVDLYTDFGQIWGVGVGDTYLVTNPFFHTAGNKAGMLLSLIHGLTVVPMAVFDAGEAMRLIQEHHVSVMNGPPTIFYSLLESPERARYDLSSLRVGATGASVVPVALIERVHTELPFRHFITAYGMTECIGTATMCRHGDSFEVIANTNGRPLPGIALRVVDPEGRDLAPGESGEVLVRGANVTRGYWEDPEATAAAIDQHGWLHTGDVGNLDAHGNLKITDRIKDIFFVGGFNVSPAEVEQVLVRHPAIGEVAVIGVPDERLGEVPKAYATRRQGGPQATAEEIIAWARERMANFKVPRSVVFVDALPRNAFGKVLKDELRNAARMTTTAS